MLSLRRGRVTALVEEHDGFVRLEVDGAPCVAPDFEAAVDLLLARSAPAADGRSRT